MDIRTKSEKDLGTMNVISFLRSQANKLEADEMSEEEKREIFGWYMRQKFLQRDINPQSRSEPERSEHQQDFSWGNLTKDQALKYLIMGWYVYDNIKICA